MDRQSRRTPISALAVVLAAVAIVATGASAAGDGRLTQPANPACVSETGSGGDCADGKALDWAYADAVSRDGKHVYVASYDSDAVAVFTRDKTTGALTQLAGTAGCISETGSGGDCTDGKALDGAQSVAISPDGKHVYVASWISDAVAVFARNKTTGALTQLAGTAGCVSETGTGGDCTDGKALDAASTVVISGDGKHVYVASFNSNAVAVFARNKSTGALTQLSGTAGCVSETGSGGDCTDGKALNSAVAVGLSANGLHVYVTSYNSDAVAVFARNASTGVLTQLAGTDGCISETGTGGDCTDGKALDGPAAVAVSADGKHVYVASDNSDAVAVFARNTVTGALTQLAGTDGCISDTGTGGDCTDGKALDGAFAITVSGDGKNVYVASYLSDAVAVFARDATTGALTQLAGTDGCISETGSGGDCTDGKALDGAYGITASGDGKHVYVTSYLSDAVVAFGRDSATGALHQLADCVSETGSDGCADGKALDIAAAVARSPDGKHVYVASAESDAVAAFARDSGGWLTQLSGTDGCVSETGTGGDCADGKALDNAIAIAISSDGKNVYVASYSSDAVAIFARDTTTGALTQLAGTDGCISETGSGGDCTDGKALTGPSGIAISPNGQHVYVASDNSDAVAVFVRDAGTGALTQLAATDGCISETGNGGTCTDGKALDRPVGIAVSGDGKDVYVVSVDSDAVAAFARNTTTGVLTQLASTAGCISETGSGGDCTDGKALDNPVSVAVSADGKDVYTAAPVSDAVAVFARNQATGVLTQLTGTAGCVSETGSGGDCTDGKALNGAWTVNISGDGKNVYATAVDANAVAAFARNKSTGALTQLNGTAGCISDDGSGGDCFDGRALVYPTGLAFSPDGKRLYTASRDRDAVVALARG